MLGKWLSDNSLWGVRGRGRGRGEGGRRGGGYRIVCFLVLNDFVEVLFHSGISGGSGEVNEEGEEKGGSRG